MCERDKISCNPEKNPDSKIQEGDVNMHRKICTLITVIAFVILSAGCALGDVALSAIPDANFRSFLSQWDYGWTVYDSDGNPHLISQNDGILSNGPCREQ